MESIRRVREAKGLSQRQLAERSGLDRGVISLFENGHRTPSLASLEKIAAGLEIEVADLVADLYPRRQERLPLVVESLGMPESIAEYARLFHLQPEPEFDLDISDRAIHRKFEAAYVGLLEAERTGGYRLFVEVSDALAALAEQLDRLPGLERATVLDRVIRLLERALAGQRAGIEAAERRTRELKETA